jgi:uncharacterized protein YndB with AHSA1/START domain
MRRILFAISALALLGTAPAHGAVTSAGDGGFAIENSIEIAADARSVYALLVTPDRWWSAAHTYSGNAANLSLEPRAGGCFCERLPDPAGAIGSVEHARVIFVAPNKQLRLSGALGPLQAEAVAGTLDIVISPAKTGVRVTMGYVVGGYVRAGMKPIAPLVDKVLREQLEELKRVAEGRARQRTQPHQPTAG